MEKIIKTIVPEKIIDKNVYYCDICGEDLEKQNTGELGLGNWNQNKGELYYAEGEIYPEDDCRDFHRIDICMNCMKSKVIPLVEKEFGVKAREHDSPY